MCHVNYAAYIVCIIVIVEELCSTRKCISNIDNHDSGYLRMAVQLYVQAHGTLPYLDPEKIQLKTDGTAKIYTHFLPIYAKFKPCRKYNTTTCKSTYFRLTD